MFAGAFGRPAGRTLILMGDVHATIIIGGGSVAATIIRFPFIAMVHGLPMGIKFAFSMRSTTQRALVGEIAGLAEIVRKSGPMVLRMSRSTIRS